MPKRSQLIVLGVALVALLLFGSVVRLIGDLLWFNSVGLPRVFWTALLAKLSLGASAMLVFWAAIYVNVRMARRRAGRSKFLRHIDTESPMEALQDLAPFLETVISVGIVVIAYLVGTWAAVRWETVLRFMNAVPFGVNDPIMGRDIAVNVFAVPFYRFILNFLFTVAVFSAIGVFMTYVLRGCFMVSEAGVWIAREAKNHLIFLLGCVLFLLAFHFHLGIFDLLVRQRTVAPGAGYADVHAYLIFLKGLRFVAALGAGLIWYGVISGRRQTLFAAVGTGAVIAGMILAVGFRQVVQQFKVGPSELTLEMPFIEKAIEYTRRAYKVDSVREETFAASEQLTLNDLRRNSATIQNIRLWDHVPLRTTYGQLQEIRTYYEFLDVDNDRYIVEKDYRQVMLSPRELLPENLPSRNWINEHLTYTHGYGLCQGPVNRISDEGLPEFFIKDIPPRTSGGITITRPEIYFGEANAGYAIVKTDTQEFDYPSGDENVYTRYAGTGGVEIGSFGRRLLFALYFREPKILFTGEIAEESRILYYRPIKERLAKAAPFLFLDPDPYLVISDEGRLFWFVDAYTHTDRYPYSQAAGADRRTNYLRNSVKIVVDAYNGSLRFYIADQTDPMIKTYAGIFPGMFQNLSDMPEDLRRHVRYPHWYFNVQANVYATYHMLEPQVFYNREDLWAISRRNQSGRIAPMEPYYTIMKLASEKGPGATEEFILMVPFTPAMKKNMIAWMAARCDQPHYGDLVVYNFPKQKLVYGPEQIDNRIDQDAEISQQITLWDSAGSRVIRGSLLVIPVEESLLYIQPLYLEAQGGGLPELRRVIVVHGNSIAMEANLELGLARLFGGATGRYARQIVPGAAPVSRSEEISELARQADKAYQEGKKALARNDWEGYGRAMAELERLLRLLSAGSK